MKVLTLSHTYEPIGVISWQKALILVLTDKVSVLSETDHVIRSPSATFRVPSVIVYKSNRRLKNKSVRFSRKNVWIRDEGRCQYCNNDVALKDLTLDHVIPKTRGGKTEWANVVTCCYRCNQKKSDKTVAQAGMKLFKPVVKPSHLPYIGEIEFYNSTDKNIPEDWAFWLGKENT
jgi:5-methylcytosine-specific restriction endonuclease McrA